MTKKTNKKRALFTSMLSLLLCVSMLIGSTFAWFTDEATTGVNTIVSGNLDIALEYSHDMTDWKDAETATEEEIFGNDLWEPGFAKVVYFKVINKGNLAVKYQIGTNLVENIIGKTRDENAPIDLTQHIKFGIVNMNNDDGTLKEAFAEGTEGRKAAIEAIGAEMDFTGFYAAEKNLVKQNDEAVFAMVAYMPEETGNEANHNGTDVPSIKFGVSVLATQLKSENDSFDNTYDEDALYSEPIKIDGEKGQTLDLDNSKYVVKGGYDGVVYATNGGEITIEGDGTVVSVEDGKYAMAVFAEGEGSKVTINGGTYTQQISNKEDDHFDLIYAKENAVIEINGGTFKSETPQWTLNLKDNTGAQIIVKGGRFYKFDPSNGHTEPTPDDPHNFVADGYTVIQKGDWYEVVEGYTATPENAETVIEASEGKPVYLTAGAYELTGVSVPSNTALIGVGDVTLNVPKLTSTYMTVGAGAKLQNIDFKATAEDTNKSAVINLQGENVTIEDCNFDLTGTYYYGILVGGETNAPDAVTVIKNCTFKGGFEPISCGDGTTGNGGGTPGEVLIDSCKFENCTYSIHLNATGADLTVKNSDLYGWVTIYRYANGTDKGDVLFEKCTFEGGHISMHGDMEFVDCEMADSVGFVVRKSGQANERAFNVKFTDTTLGGKSVAEKIISDPKFDKDFSITADNVTYNYSFENKTWTKQQ